MRYASILLANAAALLPVWFGHWSVFALLALYWFENVATGVFQFLRMRAVERVQGSSDAFPMSSFFAVHYGIFTLVHGIFVGVFFGLLMPGAHTGGAALWWLSAAVVGVGQWLDYRRHYVRGDAARHARLGALMGQPYGRVVVLHLVVLLGGWLALSSGQPRAALLLLIGLKLVIECAIARFFPTVQGRPVAP